jgi:hypothetical protein
MAFTGTFRRTLYQTASTPTSPTPVSGKSSQLFLFYQLMVKVGQEYLCLTLGHVHFLDL